LAEALEDLRPYLTGGGSDEPPRLTVVAGTMADKDVDGIILALAGSASVRAAHIIATQVDLPRALDAGALADRWQALVPEARVEPIADVETALDRALATGSGPIVIAGSLYLVGEARRRWVDDALVRDPEPSAS
jgi:folylpolyglutamate synthase/dihydropteroate synthase